MRKLIAAATLAAALVLAALPAGAEGLTFCDGGDLRHEECPTSPPVRPDECRTTALLRIAERSPQDPHYATVYVAAWNTNPDTAGAHDARLTVTYWKNGLGQQARTVIGGVFVPDGGGSFATTFRVPSWRGTDGLVTASIVDVGCDREGEKVHLADVSTDRA